MSEQVQEKKDRTQNTTSEKIDASPSAVNDGAQQTPPHAVSDEEFAPERGRWVHENERLNEKYDTIIKGLQDAVANPFPQDLIKREEQLRARYDELRLRVSESRKAGKDMLIPALVLRQFTAKLGMAHATRDPKDYEIVRILLEQAAYEIEDAVNQPVIDVRKEVLHMAGLDEKEPQGTLKKEPPKGAETKR